MGRRRDGFSKGKHRRLEEGIQSGYFSFRCGRVESQSQKGQPDCSSPHSTSLFQPHLVIQKINPESGFSREKPQSR